MRKYPVPIARLLRSPGSLSPLLERSREQERLLCVIREAVEPALRVNTLAALQKGRQLILYASSPVWASRLRFGSRALREALRKQGMRIDKVTVRIMLEPGVRAGTRQAGGRRLSSQNARLIQQLAGDVTDPALQSALERLAKHVR